MESVEPFCRGRPRDAYPCGQARLSHQVTAYLLATRWTTAFPASRLVVPAPALARVPGSRQGSFQARAGRCRRALPTPACQPCHPLIGTSGRADSSRGAPARTHLSGLIGGSRCEVGPSTVTWSLPQAISFPPCSSKPASPLFTEPRLCCSLHPDNREPSHLSVPSEWSHCLLFYFHSAGLAQQTPAHRLFAGYL